jgi:MFS family permease
LCVPDLLGVDPASVEGKQETLFWTASLSSLLLVGWAIGGILFGKVTDRIGRTKTLLLTMFVYAVSTAALRVRAQHLGAGGVPLRRQPGHRR